MVKKVTRFSLESQGSELSKTVATFIVQKLLLDEQGLLFATGLGNLFVVKL